MDYAWDSSRDISLEITLLRSLAHLRAAQRAPRCPLEVSALPVLSQTALVGVTQL